MAQKKSKTAAPQESAASHPTRKKKTAAVEEHPVQTVEAETKASPAPAAKPEKKPKTAAKKTTARKKAAVPKEEGAATAVKEKAPRKTKKKEAAAAAPSAAAAAPAPAPVHAAPVKHAEPKPAHTPARHAEPKTAKPHEAKPVHAPAPAAPAAPAPAAAKPAQPATAPVPAAAPAPAPAAPAAPVYKGVIKINELTTVRDLAEKTNQRAGDLIRKLLSLGSLATINQRLDADIATLLAHELGYDVNVVPLYAEESLVEEKEDPAKLRPRPPVVTIMGHVDHGKTSLLDAIRESRIVDREAGGITQHIGAYKVKTPKGEIAFLDTPGHEAFTAMRSRGTKATDLVILVVSAVDGVMPQTVEAIDHARAASVPIIVAINKIDLPTSNPQQIKQELSKYNLMSEDWGGDTIMVEVSAKKNIHIDDLLEMILLKAEMMELKADPSRTARGVVIEAKLDPRRGSVATVLVQNGTLSIGDNFVVGSVFGKIRAMIDEHGQRVMSAPPSTPVEILGIAATPQAGDQFIVVQEEREAREIATARQNKAREDSLRPRHHLTLEDISSGKVKELRLILKTDVQGSLGALRDSLERLSTAEINLNLIRAGVGGITEADVTLAAASDALIIGFNIRPESAIEKMADQEGVSIRVYRIIYEIIADVKAAMEGLLEPTLKEVAVGKAVVRQVFKVTKAGTIAGSMITDGKAVRGSKVRLVRDNVIVYEGTVSSLRRFKEDVKEVEKGYECGISLENFTDIKPGDTMELYAQEKMARKLEG